MQKASGVNLAQGSRQVRSNGITKASGSLRWGELAEFGYVELLSRD